MGKFSRERAKHAPLFSDDLQEPPSVTSRVVDPTKPFNFLLLPGEIRNRIMEYILVPGDVFIPKMHVTDRDVCYEDHEVYYESSFKSAPGFQFLAASRQTYAEGHKMFYKENNFHLPFGPMSHNILGGYRPKHQDMIQRMTVHTGLFDLLDSDVLNGFRTDVRAICVAKRWAGEVVPGDATDLLTRHGVKILAEKFQYIRATFQDLQELTIVFSGLEDIPWKNGLFDAEGLAMQEDELEHNGNRIYLNTDYTVDGNVTLVLKGADIQSTLRNLRLKNNNDFMQIKKLLPFTIAYAEEQAYNMFMAWGSHLGFKAWSKKLEAAAEWQKENLDPEKTFKPFLFSGVGRVSLEFSLAPLTLEAEEEEVETSQ